VSAPRRSSPDTILDVVLALIEADGHDAVQLRVVAERAGVSLSTIYKHFGPRDALLVAAMERWRAEHMEVPLSGSTPARTTSDGLVRFYRQFFEPWERNPRMLEAFYRARTGPGGDRLEEGGRAVLHPLARAAFGEDDDAAAEEVLAILDDVVFGAISRFANQEIDVTDILPRVERAVRRLTAPSRRPARRVSARRSP
jgi:AcrR family transcriptional regulator